MLFAKTYTFLAYDIVVHVGRSVSMHIGLKGLGPRPAPPALTMMILMYLHTSPNHSFIFLRSPRGCAAPGKVPCQGNTQECLSKLKATSSLRKIVVTCKSPVGDISAVTLIRTDTTLDHSQKAEKV